MSRQTFVIVGASLAGAKAAEELRKLGCEDKIVLVGAEAERPYERPPLSKEHLRGESDREKVFVHDPDFYTRQEIELITGHAATDLDIGGGAGTSRIIATNINATDPDPARRER